MRQAIDHHPVPRLRMTGGILPTPYTSLWCVCVGITLLLHLRTPTSPWDFPTKAFYVSFVCPICATFPLPTHPPCLSNNKLLKSRPTKYEVVPHSFFLPFCPYFSIRLSPLSSSTLNTHSSFRMKNQRTKCCGLYVTYTHTDVVKYLVH
jgi:hypothetical protein